MIAYVESNFVLEIVLGQEQAASAEAMLALAESGAVDLVLPALAFAEPFATVTQRERARRRLVNDIATTLRDLQRSAPHQLEAVLVADAVAGLANIAGREYVRLHEVIARLLVVARRIKFESARFALARAYQSRYGFSPQDSIIYASVISDLQTLPPADPKCFLTRNSKDFDDPDIVAELSGYNCHLFFSFEEGLRYCTP
jgi:predicted nucleic acid-binding protein